MSKRFIPVSAVHLHGNEGKYVTDCIETSWISSCGSYLDKFEKSFAEYCGTKHAVACCNGTVALHLALLTAGVQPGDEVMVPTLSFVATANAVVYCGAKPIFMDSNPDTWTLDVSQLQQKLTARTKAILPVHIYGQPADMDPILSFANEHGLAVIEDAAEAHGATYKGKAVGSLATAATFSFYGNKIITTGEGGMVTTDDDLIAGKIRLLRGQGMQPDKRYWHPIVGYNYRMTNIEAAVGLGQLEDHAWHSERRAEIFRWYSDELCKRSSLTMQHDQPWSARACWLFTVLIDPALAARRDWLINALLDKGIETRPVFYPMHVLPPYVELLGEQVLPVAEDISRRGISLPTHPGLTRDDVSFVSETLCECLEAARGLREDTT